MNTATKFDLYETITANIITSLEKGIIPWRKPWNASDSVPCNFITRKPYNGINFILLSLSAYNSPYWLTYKQAQAKGGNVRKGEKARMVVYWTFLESKEKDANGKPKKIPLLRYYSVFNLEQTDIPEPVKNVKTFEPIERAAVIANSYIERERIAIKHAGNRACYHISNDSIDMPKPESFITSEHYYATLFHEMTHSTGAKNRLNRTFGASFGNETYSKEELIAELGSAFLCANCSISNDKLEINNAAYIQSWIQRLNEDKRLIISASSKAHAAVKYILNECDERIED